MIHFNQSARLRSGLALVAGVALLSVAGCAVSTQDSIGGRDRARLTSSAASPVTGSWTYTASSVAGNATPGYSGDGSAASSAQLQSPRAIVMSTDGQYTYIADTWNDVIRAVNTSTGVITRIAGQDGVACQGPAPVMTCGDGGSATQAQLNRPSGLALSPDGSTLYIADTGSNRIRALNLSASTITTIAGTGQIGFGGDSGNATQALLAGPLDVGVDPSGNIYIADTDNNRIREVNSSGVITTIAGSSAQCTPSSNCGVGGPATQAQLAQPSGVSYSQSGFTSGELLIADTNSNVIRSINSSGTFGTVIGTNSAGTSPDQTPAAQAQLNQPRRVTVDSTGRVVVSDTGNKRFLVASPTGGETWQADASSGVSVKEPWSSIVTAAGITYADATSDQVSALTKPSGPTFTWSQCGPDAYSHDPTVPSGRVTATALILPGTTTVSAQAWGAAGAAAYVSGQPWPSAPGGAGGYAQTTSSVPATQTQLAAMVGCTGQSYAQPPVPQYDPNPAWNSYGGGGGATTLADLPSYLNGVSLPSTYVVAGGGGGGSGPNCVQGPGQSQVYLGGDPCEPYLTSINGFAGGNGGGNRGGAPFNPGGAGGYRRAGQGNGIGGWAPDAGGAASGASGFGGPGGNSSGTSGWGPQWCASGACSGTPGAGGNSSQTGGPGTGGGGGGGGAGGGAGGYDDGDITTDAGSGGGSWSQCGDSTPTGSPSTNNGKLVVTLGSQATGACSSSGSVPASVSGVTISGGGAAGIAMTANAQVAGTPGPSTSYQWSMSTTKTGTFAPISGATGSSYTPTADQANTYIQVTVTANNGGVASQTSSPVHVKNAAVPTISGVSISGTVQANSPLTADVSGVTGLPAPNVTYQWMIGSNPSFVIVPIPGATGKTYTPPASQLGDYLSVVVSASNGVGSPATASSSVTAAIAGVPAGIGSVSISGTPTVGTPLTAVPAGVTGVPAPTVTYQWWVGQDPNSPIMEPITGANGSTYTPTASDKGMYLKVSAYVQNPQGPVAWVASPLTAAVN